LPSDKKHCELPVLLLFNLDSTWAPHEIETVVEETKRLGLALREIGHPITFLPVVDSDLSKLLICYQPEEHIVFNLCEAIPGIPHSEAQVTAILESLGFVYTGSNPAVLALSEDKPRIKEILTKSGIPTPEWCLFRSPKPNGWTSFPAIVKASHEHGSEGITPEAVVMTEEDLLKRVAYVLDTFHQPALVENFIDGREFHASLWGNGHIEMLPPAEMDFSAFCDVRERLCTYDSKFVPESTHYRGIKTLLPAPLDEDEYRLLEQIAVSAYRAIGCQDYARIDIRLQNGVFYVLDVNPNTDISADASMACAAELDGYSYGDMGSRLVRMAAQRHPVFKQWD
jgi:D-alanine-D-alanine ligase